MWGAGETPEEFFQRVVEGFKKLEDDPSLVSRSVDEMARACLDGESSRISRRICRPKKEGEKEEPSCCYQYKKCFYMIEFTWKACDTSGRVFRTSRLFANIPCPYMAHSYLESCCNPGEPGGIRVMAADGSYEVFRIGICMKEFIRGQDDKAIIWSEYIPINHRTYMGIIWTDREGESLREPIQIGD